MLGRYEMAAATQSAVEKLLSTLSRRFIFSVDLGCGVGDAGPLLKRYTQYLIGIDHNQDRLKLIKRWGGKRYDKLVLGNIETFYVPEADSIFMFDVLEHFPKEEGYVLLEKWRGKFIMLTTPSKFFRGGAVDGHRSLWSVDDFYLLGFNEVYRYAVGPLHSLLFGKTILAWRG